MAPTPSPLLFLFALLPSEEERLMARVRARRYEGVIYREPGFIDVLLDVVVSVFVVGWRTVASMPWTLAVALAAAAVSVIIYPRIAWLIHGPVASAPMPNRYRHGPELALALAPVLARQDPEPVLQPQVAFEHENAPFNGLVLMVLVLAMARKRQNPQAPIQPQDEPAQVDDDGPAAQPAPVPVHERAVQAHVNDEHLEPPASPVDELPPILPQAEPHHADSPVPKIHVPSLPLAAENIPITPSVSQDMEQGQAGASSSGGGNMQPLSPVCAQVEEAGELHSSTSSGSRRVGLDSHVEKDGYESSSSTDLPQLLVLPASPLTSRQLPHVVSASNLTFDCPSSSPRQEHGQIVSGMASIEDPDSGPAEPSSSQVSVRVKGQSSDLFGGPCDVSTGESVAMGSEDPFAVGSLETEDTVEKRKAEAFFAPVSTSSDSINTSFSLSEDTPSSRHLQSPEPQQETGFGGETEDEVSVLGAGENDKDGMSPPLPPLPQTPAFERGQERRKGEQMFVFGLDRTCEWGFTHDAVDSCHNVLRTPAHFVPAGFKERRVAPPTTPTLKDKEVVFSPPISPRLVHLPETPFNGSAPSLSFTPSSPNSASTSQRVQTPEQGSVGGMDVKGKGKETTLLRPTSPRLLALPVTPAAIRIQEQRVCSMMDHHEANTSDEWRFTAAAVEGCHGVLRTPLPVAPRFFVKEERLATPVLSGRFGR
ncbi:hypothetical protein FB45DRAFT_931793 [Roridomyces roridus]|uniref:Uncharacterized protein n=1 Tax=Roridomyces roridus TaxID=1738132 RepID=A0AAD7FG70_9AGAR|nr:hypothetical protein FB45DRAFT_931793 [Roridomyces roridus]